MKIQTFIIVHTVQLLIENYQKFLTNCSDGSITFMLVGIGHDTELLKDLNLNIVHCETIEENIEFRKNLLHLTAIHLIVQMNLIDQDTNFIRFLEYDMIFQKNYIQNCNRVLNLSKQFYTHHLTPMTNCWMTPKLQWLWDVNEKVYKETFKTSIQLLSRKSKSLKWCCSINFICSNKFFFEFYTYYLNYFEPHYRDAKMAGNLFERLYTLYCLHMNIEYYEIPGLNRNGFQNSHGTS